MGRNFEGKGGHEEKESVTGIKPNEFLCNDERKRQQQRWEWEKEREALLQITK